MADEGLFALRAVGDKLAQVWPLRRLGVVCAWQPAIPTPLPQAPGPENSQATARAHPFWRRLAEVQPLVDPGTAGGPYCRRREVPEPATAGPVGSVDWPAVFDSGGICGECRRTVAAGSQGGQSPANTGDFAIHLGYTPEYHRSTTVGTPGGQAGRKADGRMANAARTRQGPLRKCLKCKGLPDPDGRITGILPRPCGGRQPAARPLSLSPGGQASARAQTSPDLRQGIISSHQSQ